jgi:hypothetical protein
MKAINFCFGKQVKQGNNFRGFTSNVLLIIRIFSLRARIFFLSIKKIAGLLPKFIITANYFSKIVDTLLANKLMR